MVGESVKKAIETTLEQTFQATSLSAQRFPLAFIRECLSLSLSLSAEWPYKSFETQHCARFIFRPLWLRLHDAIYRFEFDFEAI